VTSHGIPQAAHTLPTEARGGHGKRTYSDEEILEMYVLLHEAPHIVSPEAFTARSTARTRADVIAEQLEEYPEMEVKVSTHYDENYGGYRWTLTRIGG
jgi:hypothetical protein